MNSCDSKRFVECKWNSWLWYIIASPLVVFGTVGNVLNIIILSRKRLSKYSTSIYLTLLAGSDLLLLWTSALPNILLNGPGIDIKGMSSVLCKATHFVARAAGGISTWLLVMLSLERMLLSKFPVICRTRMNRKNAVICSACVVLLNVLLSSHFPFGMDVHVSNKTANMRIRQSDCDFASESYAEFYKTYYPLTVLIVFNVIPILLITVSNLLILETIFSQKRKLAKVEPQTDKQQTSHNQKVKSSTRLIIFISIFFLITTMPYLTSVVFFPKSKNSGARENARYILRFNFLLVLIYCNYTFNFILYVFTGTLFAKELRMFLKEIRLKLKKILDTSPNAALNANKASTTYDTPLTT